MAGLKNTIKVFEEPKEQPLKVEKPSDSPAPLIPPIYTANLDGNNNTEVKKEEKQKTVEQPKPELESMATKRLIESIGKLDQMRKDGSISQEEYTKLRSQMIKKYVK